MGMQFLNLKIYLTFSILHDNSWSDKNSVLEFGNAIFITSLFFTKIHNISTELYKSSTKYTKI